MSAPERLGIFLRKGGIALALRLMAAISNYALILCLARWLSSDDFGQFMFILSGVTFLAVCARLGTHVSVVRFLGIYRAQHRVDLAEGIVRAYLGAVGFVVLIFVVGTVIFLYAFKGITNEPYFYVFAAVLIFPAFTFNDTLSGILRSYGNVFWALAPKEVLWRLLTIGICAVLLLRGATEVLNLAHVLIVSGVTLTLLVISQSIVTHRLRRFIEGVPPTRDYAFRDWLRSTVPLWLTSVASVSFRTLDVILVGAFLSIADAGSYFAASRLAELLAFILSTLNLIVGPSVARGQAKEDIQDTQKKLSLVAVFLFASSAFLFLFFMFFGHEILGYMNEDFVSSYWVLVVLSFGHMINVMVGSAGVVLNMTGHETVTMRIMFTTAPLALLCLAIITPIFGAVGAAFSIAGGIILLNLRLLRAVLLRTPFDPSILGVRFLFARNRTI